MPFDRTLFNESNPLLFLHLCGLYIGRVQHALGLLAEAVEVREMQDAHKTDPWAGVEQGQSSGVCDPFNERRDDPRNAGRKAILNNHHWLGTLQMRDSMPLAVIKHDLFSFKFVPVKSVKYDRERSRAGPHVRPGFMGTVVCGSALQRSQARTVAAFTRPSNGAVTRPSKYTVQGRGIRTDVSHLRSLDLSA